MQEEILSEHDADQWFKRNEAVLLKKRKDEDPIYKYLSNNKSELTKKTVLEIGCANGYRLNWLAEDFDSRVFGFDISNEAIQAGKKQYSQHLKDNNLFHVQNAVSFWHNDSGFHKQFADESLDVVIFGFCLYLYSPEILPTVVARVDRALKKSGVIIIYDFNSPPMRRRYHHLKKHEVYSYKMDFSKLFTWHPCYKLIYQNVFGHSLKDELGDPATDCALSVIKKIPKELGYINLPE